MTKYLLLILHRNINNAFISAQKYIDRLEISIKNLIEMTHLIEPFISINMNIILQQQIMLHHLAFQPSRVLKVSANLNDQIRRRRISARQNSSLFENESVVCTLIRVYQTKQRKKTLRTDEFDSVGKILAFIYFLNHVNRRLISYSINLFGLNSSRLWGVCLLIVEK